MNTVFTISVVRLVNILVYKCAYNQVIRYQWDRNKALTNRSKHGIDFADAVSVFTDELAITIFEDRFAEERFVTMGMDARDRILVVVLCNT